MRWVGPLLLMSSCVTQRTLVGLNDDAGLATDTAPVSGEDAATAPETSEPPSAPATSQDPVSTPV